MKTDALARRLRFAPPNPAVRRIVPQESDLLMFAAISRHGPLPSHYLFEFAKHKRTSYINTQKRLTELYNGDEIGPYLTRPPQQFAGFEARYQHTVYDLAPRAKTALAEQNRLSLHSPRRSDPFLHQLMGACVAASIELTTACRGIRYIPREEILTHPRARPAREASNPMALPLSGDRHTLVPDDIFGLEYPEGGFRFFAIEIDRNTESIERRSLDSNTFGRKIANYMHALGTRAYEDFWGLPNLHVLTVTTNGTHANNIMEYVRKQPGQRFADRFAFAVEPSFGANWRVPKMVLGYLLDESWTTPAGLKDIAKA